MEIRRWRFGGGDSEPWRSEDRGAGTWELERFVVTSSLVASSLDILVVPRPGATEDPRRRPTQSVVVLQEFVVDSTGVDHVTNNNNKLRQFVQTLCLVLTVYKCSDGYMTQVFVYSFVVHTVNIPFIVSYTVFLYLFVTPRHMPFGRCISRTSHRIRKDL